MNPLNTESNLYLMENILYNKFNVILFESIDI